MFHCEWNCLSHIYEVLESFYLLNLADKVQSMESNRHRCGYMGLHKPVVSELDLLKNRYKLIVSCPIWILRVLQEQSCSYTYRYRRVLLWFSFKLAQNKWGCWWILLSLKLYLLQAHISWWNSELSELAVERSEGLDTAC